MRMPMPACQAGSITPNHAGQARTLTPASPGWRPAPQTGLGGVRNSLMSPRSVSLTSVRLATSHFGQYTSLGAVISMANWLPT